MRTATVAQAGLLPPVQRTSCTMTLLPTNFGVTRRDADVPPNDVGDGRLRAEVRVPGASSSPKSEGTQATSRSTSGVKDLSRLSVDNGGRLYWDDKPVVVRRRLQLSFWQKLGTILIAIAALVIALSGTIHGAIRAHDWMCHAKWITAYCPAPQPAAPTAPTHSVRPELPN